MLGLTSWRDCRGNQIRERFSGGHVADCRVMRPATVTGGDIWKGRSLDFWERWRRSGHSTPLRQRQRQVRPRATYCGRIPSPTCCNRSRTLQRCCGPSTNHAPSPSADENVQLAQLYSATTTIITTTANIADIMTMMMRPGSSSYPDIVVTITITTTIITASTAATTEVARHRMTRKQDLKGPVFLCAWSFLCA